MKPLDPLHGYRLWAPTYGEENAVSFLEDQLVRSLTPPLAGKRLLDAGCGTGRRLRGIGAAMAVGVDLSPDMIAAGGRPPLDLRLGDVRDLPVANRSFDVIWCRLVLGHLRECRTAYRELDRAADDGAWIIVTDFHPEAHRVGHRRTFRVGETVHELEHHVHELGDHVAAAGEAGLHLAAIREGRIGEEVRSFYQAARRDDLYERDLGLPIVIALAFRRSR